MVFKNIYRTFYLIGIAMLLHAGGEQSTKPVEKIGVNGKISYNTGTKKVTRDAEPSKKSKLSKLLVVYFYPSLTKPSSIPEKIEILELHWDEVPVRTKLESQDKSKYVACIMLIEKDESPNNKNLTITDYIILDPALVNIVTSDFKDLNDLEFRQKIDNVHLNGGIFGEIPDETPVPEFITRISSVFPSDKQFEPQNIGVNLLALFLQDGHKIQIFLSVPKSQSDSLSNQLQVECAFFGYDKSGATVQTPAVAPLAFTLSPEQQSVELTINQKKFAVGFQDGVATKATYSGLLRYKDIPFKTQNMRELYVKDSPVKTGAGAKFTYNTKTREINVINIPTNKFHLYKFLFIVFSNQGNDNNKNLTLKQVQDKFKLDLEEILQKGHYAPPISKIEDKIAVHIFPVSSEFMRFSDNENESPYWLKSKNPYGEIKNPPGYRGWVAAAILIEDTDGDAKPVDYIIFDPNLTNIIVSGFIDYSRIYGDEQRKKLVNGYLLTSNMLTLCLGDIRIVAFLKAMQVRLKENRSSESFIGLPIFYNQPPDQFVNALAFMFKPQSNKNLDLSLERPGIKDSIIDNMNVSFDEKGFVEDVKYVSQQPASPLQNPSKPKRFDLKTIFNGISL